MFSAATLRGQTAARETVLTGRVHLEDALILDIPKVAPLCDELPGLSKERVDADGVRLYCEQEGNGFPLVLLHGGPGATHHGFHPSFSRAKDFARVIYYDQRGCGQSEYKRDGGYSIAQAVEGLHNLRKALKIEKWVVLGHSYGGALAQCYTVKYPEDVAGLVLVGAQPAARLSLNPSREGEFLSAEERKKIRFIRMTRSLSVEQSLYNAFLNGDWKRQSFYRPSREEIARIALYGWKQDTDFNRVMSADLRKYDLQGAFDRCPIPTLILEGQWDLTWNTDKPEKLYAMFPDARLVLFERSAHSPFADEPEKFFSVLGEFARGCRGVPEVELTAWTQYLAGWKRQKESSLAYVLQTSSWGRKSSARIARLYSRERLKDLRDTSQALRLGCALYDEGRYEDAVAAFKRGEALCGGDKFYLSVFMMWRAGMNDLLNRREEAIALYKKVIELKVNEAIRHDQYGLAYSPSQLAVERIKEPFKRVENRLDD